jgi:hypothetical protein
MKNIKSPSTCPDTTGSIFVKFTHKRPHSLFFIVSLQSFN